MFLGPISNTNCLFKVVSLWDRTHSDHPVSVVRAVGAHILCIPLAYPLFSLCRYFKHATALASSEEDATEK